MKLKYSFYNSFVKHKNIYICFNSMSGALFTIPSNLYQTCVKELETPEELQCNNKELFDLFIKTRFIIDDDIDELAILSYRNKSLLSVYKICN